MTTASPPSPSAHDDEPRLPDAPGHVVTAAAALAAGWTYAELGRAVRRGRLHRLVQGAYVPRVLWDGWHPEARHVALARAKLATRGPEWAAARRTAAALHGLPHLGGLPSRPQLVRPGTGVERASSTHERVATLPPGDVVDLQGFRVTSLARTAVDVARDGSFDRAVVVCDAALRAGAHPDELAEVLHRCATWPGSAEAHRVIAFADGRAEGALESYSRALCRRLGLPVFEPQVEVWCGSQLVARVDGLFAEWGVVGEADGLAKYGSREDLLAEKGRQDNVEDFGLVVVRWGWKEANRPALLEAKLRRAQHRASRSTLDPAVRLVPTTLAQAQARYARQRRRRPG